MTEPTAGEGAGESCSRSRPSAPSWLRWTSPSSTWPSPPCSGPSPTIREPPWRGSSPPTPSCSPSLLVTAGRTADRLGRRRIFFGGLGVFTLGSALCALAPSVALLIAGRVVQGVGAAAMVPSSVGLLLAAFPTERRSQIVALWGGVGALAVATGPSLGAALISLGGWRWAFFINLPVGLVAWLVGRRVLTESPGRRGQWPGRTMPAWPC